jgi:hypothetical protein
VATAQRGRWDHRRRLELALSLLAQPASAQLDALVTDECAFEALPDVQARLATAPGETLTQRVRYG